MNDSNGASKTADVLEFDESRRNQWEDLYPLQRDSLQNPRIRVPWSKISSMGFRIGNIEKEIEELKKDRLTTTHPRIELSDSSEKEQSVLDLKDAILQLKNNFDDIITRLTCFIALKDVLCSLNTKARGWNKKYLLRSIIAFYDSIKHAFAEELSEDQLEAIIYVGNILEKEEIDREKYRGLYKKLFSAEFRILPEPMKSND